MVETISFSEFQKLDIRIGRVLKAEQVKGTENLIRLEVDLGKERRQLVAGIARWYKPEEIEGKLIVVLVNLEPKKFRGIESQGMLLAADTEEKPVLLTVEEEVPPGTKVR